MVNLSETCDNISMKMVETAAKDATITGLQSIEKLVESSSKTNQKTPNLHSTLVADLAVDKFKKFISLLGGSQTGHARWRKAPVQEVKVTEPVELEVVRPVENNFSHVQIFQSLPSNKNSVFKKGSVENVESTRSTISFGDVAMKRKCGFVDEEECGPSGGCHCSKKSRKSTVKQVVRIPAVSIKMADIPSDDFSWRKYGQKRIKGSPHPRGYYRCSSVKGCPAQKQVERALDDPAMLIVTYKGEHSH